MKRVAKNKALFTITAHIAIALFILVYIKYLGCPIRHFFGVPCPGCGLSRAYLAFFSGDIGGAFACHPLFPVVVPVIFLFLHNDVFHFHIGKKASYLIAVLIITLFISVYIVRVFILHDPGLTINFDNSVLHNIIEYF